MKLTQPLRAGTAILALLALCFSARAQTSMPENPSPAGSPPRYINVVHERLKPGRGTAYDAGLSSIRDSYERFDIAAYWIATRSITGPDEMLAFNFGESFGDLEKMGAGVAAGMAAHPELIGPQDRLLEENVSAVSNLIAERVDALGSRTGTVNFAKMRLLHLTVFQIRPGHEAEFVEASRTVASVFENIEGTPPWVVYAVNAGAPSPAYLVLTALSSLKDEDDAAARRAPAMAAAGAAIQRRLSELARSAYESTETNIYVVNPKLSHMPKDFTAGDPSFWQPKAAPVSGMKNESR